MDFIDSSVFFVWIFSFVIGVIIGWQKDQVMSGIIWSFLFGPLGVIVVACLPNKNKLAQQAEQKSLILQQIEFQKQQIEELKKLRQPVVRVSSESQKFRIYKDGQELGEMSKPVIKTMLHNKQLSFQDYFFDPDAGEWMSLEDLS